MVTIPLYSRRARRFRSFAMRPLVSVIIPAYNASGFIESAIDCACAQTIEEVELIVVDDASSDQTVSIVERRAASDPRLRLFQMPENGGPARARNFALDAASGEWVAILDADDGWEPDRVERLLKVAWREEVDVVADDLRLIDGESGCELGTAFGFTPDAGPTRLGPTMYVRCNTFGDQGFPLGYLKPMFRRAFLNRRPIRYRECARIGEDYQLLLDCLLDGAGCALVPAALYRYRLNPSSISRRIDPAELEVMARLNQEVIARVGPTAPADLYDALIARHQSLERMIGHAHFVEMVKARAFGGVIALLARQPNVLPLILKYGRESLLKRTGHLGFHGLRT